MAELVPVPFGQLLRRAHHEFLRCRAIFDLPERKFYRRPDSSGTIRADAPGLDLSVPYAGARAANPIGPAAGPHTQLAQNIALCWLAGARIIELKTVQVNDRLVLSRPCIHMATVGYNTEWSQELRLEDSLREYVKASMLIELLGAAGVLEQAPRARDSALRQAQGRPEQGRGAGFAVGDAGAGEWKHVVFDVSVGYDLQGIRSPAIVRWLESMRNASAIVDELRAEIPDEFAHVRDLPFCTAIGAGITLSTFHGTPADEIERIGEFLIGELGFHTVIKLNPPMLGRDRVDYILREVLGYDDVTVNPAAYERSLTFEDAIGVVRRLEALAARRGASVGVKCGNTLEVLNRGSFLKEPVQYLSGQPLHALHVALVQRWREVLGAGLQISFSAGVDAHNVADCVAAGLVPVTTCTDLLRAGGYGRLSRYVTNLEGRMRETGSRTIPEFIERTAEAEADPGLTSCATTNVTAPASRTAAGVPAAAREVFLAPGSAGRPPVPGHGSISVMARALDVNTRTLLHRALTHERYRAARNRKAPRKLGTHLWLWDCVSCSKCIPACPNDAVFEIEVDPFVGEVPVIEVDGGGWREVDRRLYRAMKPTQIAIFADACNDCGNCDVFCPEDGGPQIEKPRFFGTVEGWRRAAPLTGFVLEREGDALVLRGRMSEGEFALSHAPGSERGRLDAPGAAVTIQWDSHQVQTAVRRESPATPSSTTPAPPIGGEGGSPRSPAPVVVDLSAYMTLRTLLGALVRPPRVNFVNAAFVE